MDDGHVVGAMPLSEPRLVVLKDDIKRPRASDLDRAMAAHGLGSPSVWREVCEVMGEQHAAMTLAAIYQQTEQINSACGATIKLRA